MRTADAVRRRVTHIMGMPVSLALHGRHADGPEADRAWAEAVACLEDVDRVFSTYRPDSHVSRLHRGEITLEECPPEVAEVLAIGEQARIDSDGAFDVRRADPVTGEVVLDPSGVVKGWAVERAVRPLHLLEETDVCLSAGGDMVCTVASPGADAWRVGIEDPHDPTSLVAVVPVCNGAVATSGSAHRGGHIVDARTGRVPDAVASVTVVADSLVTADVAATTAFARGAGALEWLRGLPATSGLVVWSDGRTDLFGACFGT